MADRWAGPQAAVDHPHVLLFGRPLSLTRERCHKRHPRFGFGQTRLHPPMQVTYPAALGPRNKKTSVTPSCSITFSSLSATMDQASVIHSGLVLSESQTPLQMNPENEGQLLRVEGNATAESNTSTEPPVIALTTESQQSHDDTTIISSTSTAFSSSTITTTTASTSTIIPSGDPASLTIADTTSLMDVETPVVEPKKRVRSKRGISAVTEPPIRELRTRTRSRAEPENQDSIGATKPAGTKHSLKASELEPSPRSAKRVHLDKPVAKRAPSKATQGKKSGT